MKVQGRRECLMKWTMRMSTVHGVGPCLCRRRVALHRDDEQKCPLLAGRRHGPTGGWCRSIVVCEVGFDKNEQQAKSRAG